MPINPSLLVSAAMLQDAIIDVTAVAASNGVITCYQDNSRTILKNWYYQTGSPGNYTYATLPNPMTLSASGTIVDVNGNDALPWFYPVSETDNTTPQTYYITCVNSSGQQIFSRQNFPPPASSGGSTPVIASSYTLDNYIFNNNFWRNITFGSTSSTASTSLSAPPASLVNTGYYIQSVCPSQHDGFTIPDISFMKNGVTSTETCTFGKFPAGFTLFSSNPANGSDVTPEFYLNHACTIGGAETVKGYLFPISLHLKSMESLSCTITFWAQNNASTTNTLTVSIYQFAGAGGTTPAPFPVQTQPLQNNWTKYGFTFTMPSASAVTTGLGGDDALYLFIQIPTATTCNFNLALPSLYVGSAVPLNAFQNYDITNSIISSPRTGDVRTSLNLYGAAPGYGWVPMNDGVICLNYNAPGVGLSRADADTWPLYSLIWNQFSNWVVGGFNPLVPMYTNTGAAVAFGASAYTDFTAGKLLSLTKMLGRVIIGGAPAVGPGYTYTSFTGTGTTITTPLATLADYNGQPCFVVGTTTLSTKAIYYIGNISGGGATLSLYTSFANAVAGTSPQTVDAAGFIGIDLAGTFSAVAGTVGTQPLSLTTYMNIYMKL